MWMKWYVWPRPAIHSSSDLNPNLQSLHSDRITLLYQLHYSFTFSLLIFVCVCACVTVCMRGRQRITVTLLKTQFALIFAAAYYIRRKQTFATYITVLFMYIEIKHICVQLFTCIPLFLFLFFFA